ncbi:MAG: Tricorn protease [Fimbriimonadaceae bacterium]|nr:Tricorn protease [Fimbriimonadaceae bacterium]
MSGSIVLSLALFAAGTSGGDPIKRMSNPAVSPTGDRIAFSWQGDIWVTSVDGGRAERLTVHPATDYAPLWTRDGRSIIFASERYGNSDLFRINAEGGGLARITDWSSTDTPHSISPDGRWIYGQTNAWGRRDIFKVASAGGDLIRLTGHPFEGEYHPTVSPDGRFVAYVLGGRPSNALNPRQQGSDTGDIWLADNSSPLKSHRRLTDNESFDFFPMWLSNGDLIFLSNRTGTTNVWRMNGDGKGAKPLTRHTEGLVNSLSASQDGGVIAYELGSEVVVLRTGKQPEVLKVSVPQDQRNNPDSDVALTTGVSDYAVAPDGKRIALSLRGDIFVIPEKGGTTRRLTTHPARDDQPFWIDAKTIGFVTGRNVKREIYAVSIDGAERLLVTDLKDLSSPVPSPDGKWLALHRGDAEIVVTPIAGGDKKVVAKGLFGDGIGGQAMFSWSPDSKWVVYDSPLDRGSAIIVSEIATGKSHEVARTARGVSGAPKFLPNAKSIYYSASDYGESELFVVDLVPSEITFSEDDLDRIDEPKKAEGVGNLPAVVVQQAGIEQRVRRFARESFGAYAMPDSKSIWVNLAGQVNSVNLSTGATSPITAITGVVTDMKPGNVGQKIYFLNSGKLMSSQVSQVSPQAISFNAQYTINLREEEKALFEEIWWAMDRRYYDPKFHGVDWRAVRNRYEPLLLHCFDRREFYRLMGEMMEELDSSHLGSSPPTEARTGQADSTGIVGIEFDAAELEKGRYVVASIEPDSPADHPQSKLQAGDVVKIVDGRMVGRDTTWGAALNQKAGKRVRLMIERNGLEQTIDVKPDSTGSSGSRSYENWVAWQRRQVDSLSSGKLAYFHIRGMEQTSTQRFLREIRALAAGKQGAVIDVRFNGGGNTAHQILATMLRQPWLIRNTRSSFELRVSEDIFRGDTLQMPSILLINSQSFSNAEIFAEGFRRLKMGPIVGERTGGGVIGTSSLRLWDGGSIRMPSSGAYTIDGENLERNGRKPDVAVSFDPNAWQAGRDVQLERAVKELLAKIK